MRIFAFHFWNDKCFPHLHTENNWKMFFWYFEINIVVGPDNLQNKFNNLMIITYVRFVRIYTNRMQFQFWTKYALNLFVFSTVNHKYRQQSNRHMYSEIQMMMVNDNELSVNIKCYGLCTNEQKQQT